MKNNYFEPSKATHELIYYHNAPGQVLLWQPAIISAWKATHQLETKAGISGKSPSAHLTVGSSTHHLLSETERLLNQAKITSCAQRGFGVNKAEARVTLRDIFTLSEWDFLIETRGRKKKKLLTRQRTGFYSQKGKHFYSHRSHCADRGFFPPPSL